MPNGGRSRDGPDGGHTRDGAMCSVARRQPGGAAPSYGMRTAYKGCFSGIINLHHYYISIKTQVSVRTGTHTLTPPTYAWTRKHKHSKKIKTHTYL
jgi:hypothetical protein